MGKRVQMQSNRRRTMSYPLRKVLGYAKEEIAPGIEVLRERLECGHLQSPRHDMAGEYHAVRRRCWRCGEGIPVDAEKGPLEHAAKGANSRKPGAPAPAAPTANPETTSNEE